MLFHYVPFLALTSFLTVSADPGLILPVRESRVSFPMVKRLNLTGHRTLVDRDREHVKVLRARAQEAITRRSTGAINASISVPATSNLIDYVVSVSNHVMSTL